MFQALQLLFAQLVKGISVLFGHMKSVNYHISGYIIMSGNEFGRSREIAIPHIRRKALDGRTKTGRYLLQKRLHTRFFRSVSTPSIWVLPSF